MAVYTHLSSEDLAELVSAYNVGELVSAKGIAEGVSNSNWIVETSEGRFILTMYERRIDIGNLPYFLGLLDHLSAKGCPVPRTIHDKSGALSREIDGKAVALIEFLPGVSPDTPSPEQARAVGTQLARLHEASRDFGGRRANQLDIAATARTLVQCGEAGLARIDPSLPRIIEIAREVESDWPDGLPRSTCHTDLFPDNVLMRGDRVTGLIDFYFACEEAMAYDLAVTHAAWSFDRTGTQFDPRIGAAIVEGYESVRPLEAEERQHLPLLAQGAALRFVASRAEDWLETADDALVRRKDPMDFARRLEFYRRNGAEAFAR
ncbi:homoserine kinase [Qipengyuania sp. JC766]|uniref:homoserine kinase n=1 Tax=Qipengyuania sp. JC766 TaxID=3232139 RepID=UPI003459624B